MGAGFIIHFMLKSFLPTPANGQCCCQSVWSAFQSVATTPIIAGVMSRHCLVSPSVKAFQLPISISTVRDFRIPVYLLSLLSFLTFEQAQELQLPAHLPPGVHLSACHGSKYSCH